MLYTLGLYYPQLSFLKSIYFRTFIGFVLSFLLVLIIGKPFIKFLKIKKFGEEIRECGPASHYSKRNSYNGRSAYAYGLSYERFYCRKSL